jgi:hypothetical protein
MASRTDAGAKIARCGRRSIPVLQRHSHDGISDCLEYRSDDYECQNPHDWDAFRAVGVDNPFRLKITYVNYVIDTFCRLRES